MKKHIKRPSASMIVSVCAIVFALTGTAFAANMIGSSDIENNSIRSQDIKNGNVRGVDIAKGTKNRLRGQTGAPGSDGADGTDGDDGAAGNDGATGATGQAGPATAASYSNPNWAVISRNTIGSPDVHLQGGPVITNFQTGVSTGPANGGQGSLQLSVANNSQSGGSPAEKASFGNEVDFFGDQFSSLNDLGFRYLTTGENITAGGGSRNTPSIAIEIDPNLSTTPSNFSTAVYLPPDPTAGWNTADADDTGDWYLTGAAGTATGCNQTTYCTFDQLQTALADGGDAATIFTVAVTKGRDFTFVGAVDNLQVNNTIYDFEPFGVKEVPVGN